MWELMERILRTCGCGSSTDVRGGGESATATAAYSTLFSDFTILLFLRGSQSILGCNRLCPHVHDKPEDDVARVYDTVD
jgi:hypothetical protein